MERLVDAEAPPDVVAARNDDKCAPSADGSCYLGHGTVPTCLKKSTLYNHLLPLVFDSANLAGHLGGWTLEDAR
jgi:hypothetical protein